MTANNKTEEDIVGKCTLIFRYFEGKLVLIICD